MLYTISFIGMMRVSCDFALAAWRRIVFALKSISSHCNENNAIIWYVNRMQVILYRWGKTARKENNNLINWSEM